MNLNMKPADAVRQQEDLYRKELRGKKFNDEWINIIFQNPKLFNARLLKENTGGGSSAAGEDGGGDDNSDA